MVYRLSPKRVQVIAEEAQSWLLSLPNSLTPGAARFLDCASHDLSASPPGCVQKHSGSSRYEVSNFSWITLKETSWSNSALRIFNSKENILLVLCSQIQDARGTRAQSCWLFPQLLCAPITTVFFCAEQQHDCRALFSFTIFTSPGPIRAIISQQRHCLLSSGPVCQASYSSLFILYEAFHAKSFWPYWNGPTRSVACIFISQANVDEKSAKLQLAKDTSFSLIMISSHLSIIADSTQHTAFMFNYFTSPFIFNYFTVKNWQHYQNSQFFLAMFKGFLNQNPQRELQGI